MNLIREAATTSTDLGTIASITRFPVKSMAGETLDAADLHWPWLHGDRQYSFVKASGRSDFPWLTARDMPELLRYSARYAEPDDPRHSAVVVTAPDGAAFDIHDPALAMRFSDAIGAPVRLLRLGRGCFDAMAVSLLTTTMAADVEQAHGKPVAIERFRANLVIQTSQATTERDWIGRAVAIGTGGARLGVDWLTPRCAMVGIDPATAERDPAITRTVAQQFDNRVGAYCSVRHTGRVARGDTVALTMPTAT